MDDEEVNFSQARFEKICSAVIRHLHNLGFGDDRIEAIPISALTGYNLYNRGPVDPSAEATMPWYSGPSLYEHLDILPCPHRREAQGPFRMPIADIHRISSGSSSDTSPTVAGRCPKTAVILAGEVTSGTVAVGDAVRVVPGGIEATVVSIQTGNGVSERKAAAGDNIGIKVEGVTSKEVRRGQVLSCIGDAAVGEYRRVEAHVVLVNFPGELRAGYSPVIDIGTASSTVQFKSLKKRMHRTTGEVLEMYPELLIQGDGARVELTMSKPMACCVFQPSRSVLGKFTIRDRKTVIAVGTILQTYLNWLPLLDVIFLGIRPWPFPSVRPAHGARHYCKLCNCWCSLHRNAIKMHERSERHLANVEREIRRQRQSEVDAKRDEAEVAKQIARMNAAAMSSMEKDAGLFDPRRRVTELPEPNISRPAVLSSSSSSSAPLPGEEEKEEQSAPSGPPPLLPPLPLALQRPPPPGTVTMPPPAKPAVPVRVPPPAPMPAMVIPPRPAVPSGLVIPPKPVAQVRKNDEEAEEKKPLEFIQKDDEQPSSALMSAWDDTKVAAARATSSQPPKIDANTGLGTWQAVDSSHSAFGDATVRTKKRSHGREGMNEADG
ncbi:hypothetical protein FOZ63_029431, partial [Perkinsus olseni]